MIDVDLRRFGDTPHGSQLLADLLLAATEEAASRDLFLQQALDSIRRAAQARGALIVQIESSGRRVLSQVGTDGRYPAELVGDALDREATVQRDGWVAAPLDMRTARGQVLLLSGCGAELADAAATALSVAFAVYRERELQFQRLKRLETILQIAQQWNETQEMEPLLVKMAEAATRLLAADRASIFLWDRQKHQLVGRPALGVEGGELIVPDDVGVVGQTLHTREPQRIDADLQQEQIHREVDKQLGYQTRSLICVPLVTGEDEVLGVFEVINKLEGNFTGDDLAALVELARHAAIALDNTQQHEDLLARHRGMVDEVASQVKLIGESPAIEALRSTIHRVADTELAILVLGENGTGKEVVAQMIHYLSRRRDEHCIAVNCAAMAETLLESELFGHEKGAFTDAHDTRQGKFELASGGTLFLDEIGELSLGGQAKLLRVLEEKTIVRVGGSLPIETDARVIAATNRNLAEMVREKKFREDLYYRLNVVTIELPPLRDRGDDILLLAKHFVTQFCRAARYRNSWPTPASGC